MIGHDAAIGILAVINKGWSRKRSHPFFVAGVLLLPDGIFLQRMWYLYHITAPGGGVKWSPPAAIFPQKCGRRHFESAVGRENTAKSRPVEGERYVHRPRLLKMHRLCHRNASPPLQECVASAYEECPASAPKITDNPSGLPGAS